MLVSDEDVYQTVRQAMLMAIAKRAPSFSMRVLRNFGARGSAARIERARDELMDELGGEVPDRPERGPRPHVCLVRAAKAIARCPKPITDTPGPCRDHIDAYDRAWRRLRRSFGGNSVDVGPASRALAANEP